MTVDQVRLGPYGAVAFDQAAAAWVIVLPGAGYSAQAPLLWYARLSAQAAGRNVLAVTDAYDRERDEPVRWVEQRAEAALRYVSARDARPVLIAKSLTSLAATLAAREGLPAIWLTPLIHPAGTPVADQVLAGLREEGQPRLLVGGSADPTWDVEVASSLPAATVLELVGANHSLEVGNDVDMSLANLNRVTGAIGRFLDALN